MNLTQEDLMIIAKAIKQYIEGKAQIVNKQKDFHSVIHEDTRFSFYLISKTFNGNLMEAGTLNVKGNFEGNLRYSKINVQEEGTDNSFSLNVVDNKKELEDE